MDQYTLVLIIAIFALLVSMVTFILFTQDRKKPKATTFPALSDQSRSLQLQAYERLVILTERISIPNLVSRLKQAGVGAKEMQLILLDTIKQEFEYNASQQIYVSPVAWDAVRNLKDQNMHIINQVATTLPNESTGLDLNKKLMEFVMTQKKGNIHTIVLEALNFEAKKVMK